MANAISYSLFGYQHKHDNCFSFATYLQSLSFNLKMAELVYPGWKINLVLDDETYNSPFKEYFDYHISSGVLSVDVHKKDDLCMMMLRRLQPVLSGKYDRLLCRDIDSLVSYRERQAVEYWIRTGRIMHAITDSVSHGIALMGGMIGVMCKEFRERMGPTLEEFEAKGSGINYKIKGADQVFLNKYVLPKIADSMVEHYVRGMPQSFRGECYNFIQDIAIPDVPEEMRESNDLIVHIGQAGFIMPPVILFLNKHLPKARHEYHNAIEDKFKELFYWRHEI